MGRKDKSGMGGGGGGVREFTDRASSSHTYSGDGRDVEQFFRDNSNYDELISGMSYEEQDDFRDWARGHFMWGQQYEGWDNMWDEDKRLTQTYDDVLDRSVLRTGVVLSRRSDAQLVLGAGNKNGTIDDFRAMEGRVITSKGSMSFGAAAEGLTIGDSSKRVEYKLKIPGGTKGSGMWIGDKRINDWGREQREFMTNRDIAVRVGKTTYNSRRGVFVVEIEYVGRQAHDYGTSGRLKRR